MVCPASGARVLLGPQSAVNPEWPITPALLREILRELDMEGFDLVVLDVSPDLSPLTTAALSACDDVFVVIVPTAGGVQDAYRSTEALRRLGLRHPLRYTPHPPRAGKRSGRADGGPRWTACRRYPRRRFGRHRGECASPRRA